MASDPDLRLAHSRGPNSVEALIGRVACGDDRAFERLYDEFSAQVYGVASRVVADPSRAEDVTQDVFLDIWTNANNFDSKLGSARTWVMTIAHRRAVDAVRRSEAQRKYDRRAVLDEVHHEDAVEGVVRAEERDAVRRCLDTLTELQLESVRLAYFNGYTYTEVATVLQKPVPTVKTRMRDGLIRLRDCLERMR
jgi:RNA polymerase sigma-70 factor, ECF subfamily